MPVDLPDEELELNLGSETDAALLARLRSVVTTAGGSISETSWNVVGSQEIGTYEILLPRGKLVATTETYVGLSIHGPASLVRDISRAVQRA